MSEFFGKYLQVQQQIVHIGCEVITLVISIFRLQDTIIKMENISFGSPDMLSRRVEDEFSMQDHAQSSKERNKVVARLHQNIQHIKISNMGMPKLKELKDNIQQQSESTFTLEKAQKLAAEISATQSFYFFMVCTLFLFLFSCLIQDSRKDTTLNQVGQYIELACQIIFLLLLATRLLKWKDEKYMWLTIDFISIITGIIGCSITDNEVSRYFKAVRTVKLLFLIKQIEILNKPASALMAALAKVGNILVPAVIIIYMYAVVGLYTFADFQYNKCRLLSNLETSENWTAYSQEIFLCGQKSCPVVNGEQYQCLNPIDYGVEPDQKEMINMVQGNGLLKYSNIFYAVLSTFKQTFVTGSSRLIILYKQVLNPIFIEIYFYSFIYLISYIYLNIFYSLIITFEWDGQKDQPKLQSGAKTIVMEPKNQSQVIQSETKQINDFVDEIAKVDNSRQDQQDDPSRTFAVQVKYTPNIEDSKNLTKIIHKNDSKSTAIVKKARIFNVFQHVEERPEVMSRNSNIHEAEGSDKQSTSLYVEYPNQYKKFQIIYNLMITLCCINLSLDFHGQDKQFKFVTDCLDFGFYCLLVVEIAIKTLIERYTVRRIEFYTKLQIIIVIVCTCGVILEAVTAVNVVDFFSCSGIVEGVFRSFKYLRIMILILRSTLFNEARLILESTFRSLYIIRHMILVWIIIVITFGLIGFHLHSYKTKVNEQTGLLDMEHGEGFQISFDGVFESMIFTMLTFYNEEWDYIMFEQYLGGGALLVIWQLISICVGLLLFSKYFMALLMKELDHLIDQSVENSIDELTIENDSVKQEQNSEIGLNNKIVPVENPISQKKNRSFEENTKAKKKPIIKQVRTNNLKGGQQGSNRQHCVKKMVGYFRVVIEHKAYKLIFGSFITLSCIALTSTHPHVDRNSNEAQPYIILNTVNKSFFILDLFLNLMVYGLFQEDYSYLRRSWLNWLNIVIIIFEILSLPAISHSFLFDKLQKIQVLRTLYFLEFRYKHDWNMRITYHSFVQLLPKVFTLLIITMIMYSYFALVLVKLYRDDFYDCYNTQPQVQILTQNDCLLWGGDWVQQTINVGNLLNSTLYLFYVATMEGWTSLLYPMMDLTGKYMNPVRDANKYINIFFVFFFFFGNLIMLNVFIGLSVSNFKRLKDKTTGESKLNKKQKEWLSVKSQIYRLQPQMLDTRPTNLVRRYAYDISHHFSYRIIKGFFFCAFLISMSLFETNMSDSKKQILKNIQYFFVAILICEYLIEILAFGYRPEYRKSFIYKKIVVIYAVVYVIVSETVKLPKFDERIMGGIFIALQFIRYLALLDEIPFAKKLLNTIVSVLPHTSNILLIICLTLFIYAIIGMELFSFLKPNIELDTFNQNYTNFSSALFALIKFSTLESPIQQISDASQEMAPNFICSNIYTYEEYLLHGQVGCGNQVMSYVFFLSFHIFYSMLLMSTVMAVIVDSYSEVKRQEEAPITKLVLEKVRSAWAKIDPEATGYIPYRQFWMFTARLLEIYMGKEKANNSISALFASKEEFLKQMSIPIYENENGVLCFQFNEVIEALTRIYMQNNFGTVVSKKVEKMFKERQSVTTNGYNKSYYTSSHVATLIILKSGLRMWKKKATNQAGRMEYKNVISKFNKGKNGTNIHKQES